jgi:ATP-binding cassette subfamily C protein
MDPPLLLPRPAASVAVEGVSIEPPGSSRIVVRDVSFTLQAGSALGIIGPSASGKSSLARALVGVWPPAAGKIRLDGATLDQWAPQVLGAHIGYLPQDVELLDGTIAQNIARFAPNPAPDDIIAAARAAGVNEMVLRMPDGYDTVVGEGGAALSAGQRQRVGLARALYKEPFLVVLDEPNSNLDGEGEEALRHAILSIRNRGGVAIVIAHRPTALANVNLLLVLAEGRVQAFGPTQEIFQSISRPSKVAFTSVRP